MCVDVAGRDRDAAFSKTGREKLRVAVAGLGLIGEGAALRLLDEADDFALCAALVRDPSKIRSTLPGGVIISDNIAAVLDAEPDVVIDALPVGDAGKALIADALARGVSIVSANKQAIAGSLDRFSKLAAESGAQLAYSAAVGGGSPMVETIRKAREDGPIVEIAAILNGTVNYILTALSRGEAFESAVKKAQEAGFAEPDATADLSGDDARAKISILCFEAFGEEIDLASVETEALTAERAAAIATAGGAWKQLSRIRLNTDGTVSAKLSFEQVADDDYFASVIDEGNGLKATVKSGDIFECHGKGAGRIPTVGSLFSDLNALKLSQPSSVLR